MTCKEFIEQLLGEYTEGDLDADSRRLCKEHVDLCKDCADYLESYRTTVEVGKGSLSSPGQWGEDIKDYELPEDLVQSILAVVRPSS